jgi:hypothetical protein
MAFERDPFNISGNKRCNEPLRENTVVVMAVRILKRGIVLSFRSICFNLIDEYKNMTRTL